jgi:hypothetical protein
VAIDGFTKLFSSIVTSTIWSEDSDTRVVWITLLALADEHGVVTTTIPGLSRVAGVPLDKCEQAITRFMGPDKYSRSSEFEGRRVKSVDGGFLLLNHGKYREVRSEAERRAYQADWARNNRRQLSTKSTHSDAEAEADKIPPSTPPKRKRGRPRSSGTCVFPDGWKPTEAHRDRCRDQGFDCDHEAQRFEAYHRARGSMFCCWNSAFTTWLLNAKRYRDEDDARRASTVSNDTEKEAAHKEGLRIQRQREEVRRRKTQAELDARRRERGQSGAPIVPGETQSLIGDLASKIGGGDKDDSGEEDKIPW